MADEPSALRGLTISAGYVAAAAYLIVTATEWGWFSRYAAFYEKVYEKTPVWVRESDLSVDHPHSAPVIISVLLSAWLCFRTRSFQTGTRSVRWVDATAMASLALIGLAIASTRGDHDLVWDYHTFYVVLSVFVMLLTIREGRLGPITMTISTGD